MRNAEIEDNRSTKWAGLFWHPEYQYFSSDLIPASILKKLRGNVRLIVKKNKYYCQGKKNIPNYNFTIKEMGSSPAEEEHDIEWYKNRIKELEEENKKLKGEKASYKEKNHG